MGVLVASRTAVIYDVVIVGGGPAGLSAALILGRCRRRVLLCDDGRPRNAKSHGLHGFLTRDGILPAELLQIGREQLHAYPTIETRAVHVKDARRTPEGFTVDLQDGQSVTTSKLLLATGIVDELPNIAGLGDFYGRSVFHCPYCDGWEVRDRRIAVSGAPDKAPGLALELTVWTPHLLVCTNGRELHAHDADRLARRGIAIRTERIARLEGRSGVLQRIVFDSGAAEHIDAMFFSTNGSQHSDLPSRLGCTFTEKGAVATGDYETTNVSGLYVAGDASRLIHLAIVAAAEGAQAAFAINTALLKEHLLRDRSAL
jgi:thioredoxin reductase